MTTTRYTRTLELGRADPESMTVECSVSSEEPCQRDGYVEILSHDPAHIDMTRARGGLPLIESHNHETVNVGIVEQLRVVGDKLRGIARFGKSQRGRELFQDVKDGIVRNLSVGYYVLREVGQAGADAIRFAWQPFEVSIVSIPADPTVGFNRSHTMSTINTSGDEPHLSRSQVRAATTRDSAEIERRDQIESIGAQYSRQIGDDRTFVSRAIREGWSVDEFKNNIIDKMQTRHTDTSVPCSGEAREWDKNVRRYNFGRALQTMLDPAAGMRAGGGLEREMGEEIARQTGRGPSAGGIMVPDEVFYAKRAISVGTSHASSAGALHIESFAADMFADAVRANTIVGALGARIMTGQTGDLIVPRKAATATMAWVAEAGSASESTPDFNQLVLKPKRISTYVIVSQQALFQSGIALEYLIRDDLMRGMMVELDRVALSGAGTGSEPTGIVNTSGIGTTTAGTNGAVISYSHLVDLEASCANANAAFGASGYAVNPKTRAYLKKSAKLGTSVTELAWNDAVLSADGIGVVCGHRAGVTTNLRSNLTKGTSTTVCSELLFGADWSELIIARFGGNEVTVDPYSLAVTGQVRITLNGFADVGVRRAVAFAKLQDALTA